MIHAFASPWEGLQVIRRPAKDIDRDGVSVPGFKRNYEWFAVRDGKIESSSMTPNGLADLLKFYGFKDTIMVYSSTRK